MIKEYKYELIIYSTQHAYQARPFAFVIAFYSQDNEVIATKICEAAKRVVEGSPVGVMPPRQVAELLRCPECEAAVTISRRGAAAAAGHWTTK